MDESLHDADAAARAFGEIDRAAPTQPVWVLPWARARLAELALRAGDLARARRLLPIEAAIRDVKYQPHALRALIGQSRRRLGAQ